MMSKAISSDRKWLSQVIASRSLFLSVIITLILVSNFQEYFPSFQKFKKQQSLKDLPSDSYRQIESDSAVEDRFVWDQITGDWALVPTREDEENFVDGDKLCLWPSTTDEACKSDNQDRIVDQLKLEQQQQSDKIFNIFPNDLYSYSEGQDVFLNEKCLINNCRITHNQEEADVLIFPNSDVPKEPSTRKRRDQIWIAYLLESPVHTYDKKFRRKHRGVHEFNWTATYRSNSDIVAPYSKFVPYANRIDEYKLLKELSKFRPDPGNDDIKRERMEEFYNEQTSNSQKSLIKSKTAKVAWFVSNCNAANNRLEYARELSKFIQVDIYGRCGNMTCDKRNRTGCLEMINKEYKYYLSFENSNCPQYITEKFYHNALGLNDLNHLVVPVVMGAPKKDYELLAPPASFIHVDDFLSPEHLARYLKLLDANDAAYNYYFAWKTVGKFIDTKFMCRICAMVNVSGNGNNKSYSDIQSWWNNFVDSSGSKNSCT